MIVVPVKQVPDSWSEKQLEEATGRLRRVGVDLVLNEPDEFAVEAALQLSETMGVGTVAVTVGPDDAREAVLRALAMGVDRGIHVTDPRLAGACFMRTSAVLAAVARKVEATLILTGFETTDSKGGVIPAMLAEHLGWPSAAVVDQPEFANGIVTTTTHLPSNDIRYGIALPAVLSLRENANSPRFPSFKGIMAAKKKPLDIWTLDDLQGQPFDQWFYSDTTTVGAWDLTPQRETGEPILDPETSSRVLAEVLAAAQGANV